MKLEIRPLKRDELDRVNEVIAESKGVWYSNKKYLDECLRFAKVDKTWLKENEGYGLYEKDELVGFLGYSRSEDFWYLEHLWVLPEKIGQHCGGQALEMLLEKARKASVPKISLLPEPNAEDFYARFGAVFTGIEVPSLYEGGPVFKEMVINL